MTARSLAGFLLACVLVAGCAQIGQEIRDIRDYIRKLRGREPAPPAPTPPPVAEPPSAAGLTLAGNCVGKEESGYAENVRVDVAGGQVRALEALIDIPGRGSCRFALADFQQTRRAPFVELVARDNSGCALRMWQQGDRVTLAASDCDGKCTRGAFEFLWPVELVSPGGGCY